MFITRNIITKEIAENYVTYCELYATSSFSFFFSSSSIPVAPTWSIVQP
jgi:hypothetical protein